MQRLLDAALGRPPRQWAGQGAPELMHAGGTDAEVPWTPEQTGTGGPAVDPGAAPPGCAPAAISGAVLL